MPGVVSALYRIQKHYQPNNKGHPEGWPVHARVRTTSAGCLSLLNVEDENRPDGH